MLLCGALTLRSAQSAQIFSLDHWTTQRASISSQNRVSVTAAGSPLVGKEDIVRVCLHPSVQQIETLVGHVCGLQQMRLFVRFIWTVGASVDH